MSTYTDLHNRIRENLTVLRHPGNTLDGITPQRVIFANPENIYEGTFKGKVIATEMNLSNAVLANATIDGGVINDAKIVVGDEEISIADLLQLISSSLSSISSLEAIVPYSMHYFGTLASGYSKNIQEFNVFLHSNFEENPDGHRFKQGDMFRILSTATLNVDESSESTLKLYENDYIIFNQDVILSDAVVSCIDIIRDALSEGEDLLRQITLISANLSNTIDKNAIDSISASYAFADGDAISVITALTLTSGKVLIEAKALMSSDIPCLEELTANALSNATQYANEKFLPLSGGTLDGTLAIAYGHGFSVCDKMSISANGHILYDDINNDISNAVSNATGKLSTDLNADFGFGYSKEENVISAHVAGKTLSFSANKFTEATMLSTVHIDLNGILWLLFKTDTPGEVTPVSVDLKDNLLVYDGENGIDIEYNGHGRYVVSADLTIARLSDVDLKDQNLSDSLTSYVADNYSAVHLSSINANAAVSEKLDTLNLVQFNALSIYELCSSAVSPSDIVFIHEDHLNAEGKTVTNVALPQNAADAANKQYVDTKLSALMSDPIISNFYGDGNDEIGDVSLSSLAIAVRHLIANLSSSFAK